MKITWHVETRKIADLIPFEKNPRSITKEGLKTLGESFDEIGLAQPINIDIDNTILSGHARYYRCKQDGIEEVDCYVPNRKLTDKEAILESSNQKYNELKGVAQWVIPVEIPMGHLRKVIK